MYTCINKDNNIYIYRERERVETKHYTILYYAIIYHTILYYKQYNIKCPIPISWVW